MSVPTQAELRGGRLAPREWITLTGRGSLLVHGQWGQRTSTCDYLATYLEPVTDDDLVFKALADPTRRFLLADYDLRPGGANKVRATEEFKAAGAEQGHPIPDVVIEGEVLEADPSLKLVTTFRMLMDPEIAAEQITRVAYEIKDGANGICSVTLTHELDGAPKPAMILGGPLEAEGAGGGNAWVLSDLKTLLETGESIAE